MAVFSSPLLLLEYSQALSCQGCSAPSTPHVRQHTRAVTVSTYQTLCLDITEDIHGAAPIRSSGSTAVRYVTCLDGLSQPDKSNSAQGVIFFFHPQLRTHEMADALYARKPGIRLQRAVSRCLTFRWLRHNCQDGKTGFPVKYIRGICRQRSLHHKLQFLRRT